MDELHAMDIQYSESCTVPTKGEGGGRKPVQITEAQLTGRGLGARLYCACFSFPRYYH